VDEKYEAHQLLILFNLENQATCPGIVPLAGRSLKRVDKKTTKRTPSVFSVLSVVKNYEAHTLCTLCVVRGGMCKDRKMDKDENL